MSVEAELAAYLDAAARTPFAWGGHDCATFPAGWVQLRLGVDPLGAWRGAYDNAVSVAALEAEAGGLLAMWVAAAELAGAPRTSAPRAGDVGLVEIPTLTGPLQLGAIRVTRAWAMLAEAGLIVQPARCLAAWRI